MTSSTFSIRTARSFLLATAVAMALSACGGGGSGGSAAAVDPPSGGGNPPPGGGGNPPPGGGGNPPPGGGGNPPPPSGSGTPVIYVADQTTVGVDELYMVQPSAPGGSVKISAPLISGGNVYDFALSPDGQSVIYIADQDINGRYELYRVNLANPGSATKLNAPLSVNRDVMDFVQTKDGTKVAYRADSTVENLFDLYLVDLSNPGASIKLSGTLVPGGSVRSGYKFSPDDARVAYRADQEVVDRFELFSVNVASPGVSTKLNSALVLEGDVTSGFDFSPDSAQVAYIADQQTDGTLELFAVAMSNPGVSAKLNGPLVAEGDLCNFTFSPDSTRVAYCADQDTNDVIELYTATLAAPGNSTKLNPALIAGGNVVAGYQFAADSSFVVYIADQQVDEQHELYRVDIASPGVATKLNGALLPEGNVWDFKFRPDGTHVGYIATQDSVSVYELYQTALATPGASTKLSSPMLGAGLWQFEYTADSATTFYSAEQDSGQPELYRVDIANPAVSTRLNGTVAQGGGVWAFVSAPGQAMTP